MGYYTKYSMEVKEGNYNSFKVAKFMFDQNEESDKFYPFSYALKKFLEDMDEQQGEGYALTLGFEDETKWYDNEKDMKLLSKEFQEVVFHLHGIGEENEDVWDKYFKNGKVQICNAELIIPPYDESKLK